MVTLRSIQGLKEMLYQTFLCCLNLNSLPAQNVVKLSPLQAYNSIYKYIAMCFSGTYLGNSILGESILDFLSYKAVCADS